ncbi:MAG: PD-(D/E)XK nuclease family protein [Candidatus Eremiobacteraeota bacterium]|nr:PD-(D/E)XK nuclease family protein [Candidatus Eremiobacteraeota bacterium]MBV8499052.1 PD-(D/E)XK nuclease family protein [Candidatus Eremiobacteraeota bacterium]
MAPPESTLPQSFVADAAQWHRSGGEEPLLNLIRSPYSGVGHDVGAAYATLARRTGALLDAIDGGRLALPLAERDEVLRFARRARRIRAIPHDVEEEGLHSLIAEIFELPKIAARAFHAHERSAAGGQIELAQAPPPEPRAGVEGWQRHFSASALNAYAECARKWFYRYACAAVEDPGSAAAAYGTALHLALEDFHADYPRPSARDDAAMRRRIRECVTWAFERNRDGFETAVEFELQVRRAQRTAQRYVDWLLVQETEAPFEVLGREVAADLDLEGRAFVGFIDRLDRDERSGGIGVVDYKTGSIAMSAAEYCDKVRRFRDFQLPFYYWARTAAGDRVTKLVLIPLRDALLDVRPIVLDVAERAPERSRNGKSVRGSIGLEELQRSRTRMIELSDRLSSGDVGAFEVATDPAACAFCNYATACARRPPPEGRRFGS